MEAFDISYNIEERPEWLISCDVEAIGYDPPSMRGAVVVVLDDRGRRFVFREWSMYNFFFIPTTYANELIQRAKELADNYPYGPDGTKKLMGSG